MVGRSGAPQTASLRLVEQTISDGPPDLELLASVEADMARVDQALRDLEDETADPSAVVAWVPAVAVSNPDAESSDTQAGAATDDGDTGLGDTGSLDVAVADL